MSDKHNTAYPMEFHAALIEVVDQWWQYNYDGDFLPPAIETIILFMKNIYDATFNLESGEWTFACELKKTDKIQYTR